VTHVGQGATGGSRLPHGSCTEVAGGAGLREPRNWVNTYSIDAPVSGAFWMMNGDMRAPTRTATHCLPLTA
jgi:hypothetical protein